jgi:hypothetical protein
VDALDGRVELGALLRDPDQIGIVAADVDGDQRKPTWRVPTVGPASCAGL